METGHGGARKGAGRKANRYDLRPWRMAQDVDLVSQVTGEHYGKIHLWGGWTWTAANGRDYRTNGEGQGLWMWIERDQDWKQQAGTMQFWLSQDREKALRKLLRSEGLAPRVINDPTAKCEICGRTFSIKEDGWMETDTGDACPDCVRDAESVEAPGENE